MKNDVNVYLGNVIGSLFDTISDVLSRNQFRIFIVLLFGRSTFTLVYLF
jgi:hypothetical protein